MAYNREWDRGKDSWIHSNQWSAQDSKANVRGREEDYSGDGKRRKFNNGGFDGTRNYEDPPSYGPSHSRQNDWSYDYGQEDRSRASGPPGTIKKRLVPSEPSSHVIFLGLDPDFTEADLQAYLVSNGCSVETVTIIREKSSGSSKGFGFAQFTSIEHARAFVDPLFPFIQMPPPASHGASATATFYKSLETGIPHNGRRVKIDYSQSATPHDKGRLNRGNMNDGTRDIGNSQSAVLLFRGLDPLSGPQAIYQAMLSSSGPGKEGTKGMRRIILIKDKVTMASFGFAFVEFIDIQSASTVLAATMSAHIHPNGFRISDRPVAASFAHPYSFQPVTDFLLRDEACLTSTNSLGGGSGEGTWVRYWDESSTIAVLEFKVEEVTLPSNQSKDKKEKKRPKYELDGNVKTVPAPASVLPISDKPVTLSFSRGSAKVNTTSGPTKLPVPGFSLDDTITSGDVQEDTGSDPNKPLVVKKVAPLIASKKTVNNINKWNQVQEELAHDTASPSASLTIPPNISDISILAPGPASETSPPPETEFQFSDITGLTCLLCARQFKTLDQLKLHNIKSDLHKKNYKDPNLREVAREKLASRKSVANTLEQPKYRDRASERRILFNQPDAPVHEKDVGFPRKWHVEASSRPITPPLPVNPGKDQSNVGNKLLKIMGWREGTGLGEDGDGRVDPIETAIYAQGVGLGASKGKELGKYTEGFSNYVHMVQDAARERFGS